MSADFEWGVSKEEQRRKKGPWTHEEDRLLTTYVSLHGEGKWTSVAKFSGLNRSGKSCRLRWVNYLRPGLKRGQITPIEEAIIMELHALWGNKWSTIARCLPGRTDNEIKNYWRTHFKQVRPPQKEGKEEGMRQKSSQQQQPQGNQGDGAEMVSPELEISDMRMDSEPQAPPSDVGFTYSTIEDQYYLPSAMAQDTAAWWDSSEEDELWSGLWNLDDQLH